MRIAAQCEMSCRYRTKPCCTCTCTATRYIGPDRRFSCGVQVLPASGLQRREQDSACLSVCLLVPSPMPSSACHIPIHTAPCYGIHTYLHALLSRLT